MSNRGDRFKTVARACYQHIEKYTVPQYGDYPDDKMTRRSLEWHWESLDDYLDRKDSPEPEGRPGMHRQDILKMIHLLAEIWIRLGEEDEENNRVFSADCAGNTAILDDLQRMFGIKL